MKHRLKKREFDKLDLLGLFIISCFFVVFTFAAAQQGGWGYALLLAAVGFPLWIPLIYGLYGFLAFLRGNRTDRQLPAELPLDFQKEQNPESREPRKKRTWAKRLTWWHPRRIFGKD